MTEETSIKDQLKAINEKLDKPEKQAFKLPFFSRIGKSKAKKGFVTAQILRSNGNMDFKKVVLEDNTIKIPSTEKGEFTYHAVEADDIFYFKKNPMVIIPDFSTEPVSKHQLVEQTKANGTSTSGQKYILARMKRDLIKPNNWNVGTILIIIVVIIGGLVAMNKFGLFGK